MNDAQEKDPVTRVECPPTKDPAVRWFIFAGMLFALSVWCYLDRRPRPEVWDAENINKVATYMLNNWGPVLFAPIGLFSLVMGVLHLTRKLIADKQGIRYGGTEVTWDQVERLDASLLLEKKILYVCYDGGRRIKLDSWKLQNFRELVGFVEANSPSDTREEAQQEG